jgi:hypothetical protein
LKPSFLRAGSTSPAVPGGHAVRPRDGRTEPRLSLPEGEITITGIRSAKRRRSRAKGQSFFIKNLLQNVIFQEAGIAGENRWWELRNRAVIWSGYAALLALLVILGGLWLTSYAKNKAYLEEVDAKVPLLDQQSKALQNQPSDLFDLLPLLNSLVDLPKSDAFDVNDPPSPAVWGCTAGMTSAMPLSRCTRKRWIRCCCPPSPCTSPPGCATITAAMWNTATKR